MADQVQHFVDQHGNDVYASGRTPRRGSAADAIFEIVIVDSGEPVDNYTLYGSDALKWTAKMQGWQRAEGSYLREGVQWRE